MPITIENPTAEAIYSAVLFLSDEEKSKLRLLLERDQVMSDPSYSDEWSEEDLRDATRSTALLIERRFGPEEVNYD